MMPLLVIQMHRLGDLILTFPLLEDLRDRFPGQPLHVVAEPAFYNDLRPGMPGIEFFAPHELDKLASLKYELAINLSSRPEAAIFTQKIKAEEKLGALMAHGEIHTRGFWQLYRMALTQNNRHNAFHWADLHRLDLGLPLRPLKWTKIKTLGAKKIGLFVGASAAAKRPDVPFWIDLVKSLGHRGFKPILLGGKAEEATGSRIAESRGVNCVNFCGKTNLSQLSAICKSLDLFITSDTGPMHLADWLGSPVLNLSMGNVHANETGPISPGQHIVRAAMSCIGCWECSRAKLYCKQAFHPRAIANIAERLAHGEPLAPAPGLELLKTGRDENGLYQIIPTNKKTSCRAGLENFWQSAFLYFYNPEYKNRLNENAAALAARYPALAQNMRDNFKKMLAILLTTLKRRESFPENFWKNQPWHSRLFAGNLHMNLQNGNFSREAYLQSVSRVAELQELFAANG